MGITERSYHYVRVGACEIKEEIAAPSINLKRMEEKACIFSPFRNVP